jgi:hypothetical protein
MGAGLSSPVGVVLVAYPSGVPGDLTNPPLKWREVATESILDFEAPLSTVLINHPGGDKEFELWLDWATAKERRGAVAMLIV